MTSDFFNLWASAHLETIAVEVPIYALFLRGRMGLGVALLAGLALQLVTHPTFWLLFDHFNFYAAYGRNVVLSEVTIWLVEAALVVYMLRGETRTARTQGAWMLALVASLIANGTSLTIGLVT